MNVFWLDTISDSCMIVTTRPQGTSTTDPRKPGPLSNRKLNIQVKGKKDQSLRQHIISGRPRIMAPLITNRRHKLHNDL